jgi:hypothetical protein
VTKQSSLFCVPGLLRCARNDEFGSASLLKKYPYTLLFTNNFFLKLTPMRLCGDDAQGDVEEVENHDLS